MTDCKDCADASEGLHHGFTLYCQGCTARAVARSPEFSRAVKTGVQDAEYRSLLKKTQMTHAEAKAAASNDRACDRIMGVTQ